MTTSAATHAPFTRPAAATSADAPAGIDPQLLQLHVAVTRRRMRAGQHVYRAGQSSQTLHVVHAGLVKSSIASSDGREKVTGFHMRGSLIGLESFGRAVHVCDAVALDDGEVWEFSQVDFLAACARAPALQRVFAAAVAAEILCERSWMLTVETLGAEQRVAALLLDLGTRLRALGYSATRIMLRMTRAEIGSFLGLKLETVTRAMSHLDECGLIDVQRRDITIRDADALRCLVTSSSCVH